MNDISAIQPASPMNENYEGLEEKIIFHSKSISWENIRLNFFDQKVLPNAVLKAAKALCYSL